MTVSLLFGSNGGAIGSGPRYLVGIGLGNFPLLPNGFAVKFVEPQNRNDLARLIAPQSLRVAGHTVFDMHHGNAVFGIETQFAVHMNKPPPPPCPTCKEVPKFVSTVLDGPTGEHFERLECPCSKHAWISEKAYADPRKRVGERAPGGKSDVLPPQYTQYLPRLAGPFCAGAQSCRVGTEVHQILAVDSSSNVWSDAAMSVVNISDYSKDQKFDQDFDAPMCITFYSAKFVDQCGTDRVVNITITVDDGDVFAVLDSHKSRRRRRSNTTRSIPVCALAVRLHGHPPTRC
jgi:hypothetical protein